MQTPETMEEGELRRREQRWRESSDAGKKQKYRPRSNHSETKEEDETELTLSQKRTKSPSVPTHILRSGQREQFFIHPLL